MLREASESHCNAALQPSIHDSLGPTSRKSENISIISCGKLKVDRRDITFFVFVFLSARACLA
jgi:hypothetical protein